MSCKAMLVFSSGFQKFMRSPCWRWNRSSVTWWGAWITILWAGVASIIEGCWLSRLIKISIRNWPNTSSRSSRFKALTGNTQSLRTLKDSTSSSLDSRNPSKALSSSHNPSSTISTSQWSKSDPKQLWSTSIRKKIVATATTSSSP